MWVEDFGVVRTECNVATSLGFCDNNEGGDHCCAMVAPFVVIALTLFRKVLPGSAVFLPLREVFGTRQ